ncbi:hypothetical protein FSP39_007694 [Pinctada imbricata]|uniref:D-3-phosphoglycerate dehydrogenase n=1 Tax=Pinctada imbricata TaxID=66713 RepID=A0AA88YHU2_PINIB|nr:hypothetical protein FSP39_007694 [Pinctada imbricata]
MAFSLKSVLISDEIDQKCVDILQSNGVQVTKNTKLSKEELVQEIAKYDGLVVRSATKVTADVINAAKNLKIIGRAGTGVDNIDCDAATKKGIIVMNTPGGNTLSAAELTCALICGLSRNIHNGDRAMKTETWSERKKLMGNELYGKTLAIVGLGRIGKEVAIRMQSFGMKTIGFDPIIPGEVSAEFGVEWMELDRLWPLADYITVHTPLIPQTKNLISDKVFSTCKKGIRVVNVARGGIIDEEALLRALESGQCAGAGLDVFTSEPPKDFTLAKHPKVLATPHLGASTVEAQERVAVEIAEQFVDLMKGTQLFGAINAQAMCSALAPETQPWVDLGQRLGAVSMATNKGQSSKKVAVGTYGQSLKKASYISAAVLAGLLKNSPAGGDSATLNLVSAPALAKQLGVEVTTQHNDSAPSPYTACISVTLDNGIQVTGTCGGGAPLLTAIQGQGFQAPAPLTDNMVVFTAKGSPQLLQNALGAVTQAGATACSVSLTLEKDSKVWGVISLLQKAPANCLDAMSKVTEATYLV